MAEESRSGQLVAAAALGLLLFGYPLVAVFDVPATVLGVPVLWAYLFVAWAAVIAVVALALRRRD
jgi:hypothetical protein